ncbi:alpha-methylacyl-CoA racemase-like [Gigantopelta aegis]|uniref:alpha-methylacyl-CoA racemase-like n=1 Tax=Gigantopelta aegis TaxID=1735272 RepID=UPI001B88C86C|nr:alpha-methylacyl-CoA racemase-like [Gigantopelta aegis]
MALKGVKVIEMAGLAPAPFCGMILADFGARVIRVDRTKYADMDRLARGKQSIAVDLKKKEGVTVIQRLCRGADVLIEPFRHGVMEKLGLGPDVMLTDNPRLVYARLTGFGQSGPLARKAGHDINYLAISGVLSRFGRHNENPSFPLNLLADFAGGGLMCALGITMALFERTRSGKGQVVDANMVEGAAYIGSFIWRTRDLPFLSGNPRGQNMLDHGSAFYEVYKTADDKYMSVGALEPQFFNDLLKGLGLDPEKVSQTDDPEELKTVFREKFLSKTRDEWTNIFVDGHLDACVFPVLETDEAPCYPHNKENQSFLHTSSGDPEPGPAPNLSRTPGVDRVKPQPRTGHDTESVLLEAGFSKSEIEHLIEANVIEQNVQSKL